MGGSSFQAPDPFSPQAVAFREKEMKQQLEMAHSEQEYQTAMAQEQREWQEDLENRRATRKQKEETERIRQLQAEQRLASDEASGIADMGSDPDQVLSNIWSALATGVSNSTGPQRKKSIGKSFSNLLTGGGQGQYGEG